MTSQKSSGLNGYLATLSDEDRTRLAEMFERSVVIRAPGALPITFMAGLPDADDDPAPAADPVNHPLHYTSHPSGVECIQIAEHMGFNLGNALKYLWRADLKGDALEDLRKARWYLDRELARREARHPDPGAYQGGEHRG